MKHLMKFGHASGSSTEQNYYGWSEIISTNFSASRHSTSGTLNQKRAKVHEVEITKVADKAFVGIFRAMMTGMPVNEVIIETCIESGGTLQPHITTILQDVVVTHHETSSAGDNLEFIKLSFKKIEVKMTPYNDQNKAESPQSAQYNITDGMVA